MPTRQTASDPFAAAVHYAANDLLQRHPDARLREALRAERIVLYGTSSPEDHALAAGYGTGEGEGGVLVAMHVGLPNTAQSGHEIMMYEDGVRFAAQQRGVTIAQQAADTLRHELEHHYGYAPAGHTDASLHEYEATMRAGGVLDQAQQIAYERLRSQPQQVGMHSACPCWARK